ncbi:hypothetical protein VNI00_009042 [Paramarasmius palmivorus]|uniref:F-box domain-containing protein n=1 Tax=Paramarasmius palmivorus TaxID=297713 RepID=A0AAW0CS40_9AGAR
MDASRMNTLVRRVVSPSDRDSASQFLVDIQKALEVCQAETDALKDRLSILDAERKRLLEAEKTYKSLLAPIHRLPTELLAHIFMILRGEFTLDLSSLPPPVQLSMVCGRWREVAFATPYLWSYLELVVLHDHPIPPDLPRDMLSSTDGNRLVRVLQRFLDRSGDYPLVLKLDLFGVPESPPPSYLVNMISALVHHSHRWASLDLFIQEHTLNLPLWAPIRGRLPLLRELCVGGLGEYEVVQEPTLDLFSACPILSVARIDSADELILQKRQIACLKLGDWYASSAFYFLNDPSWDCLEHLGLHDFGYNVDEGYRGQILMKKLKKLEVGAMQHTHIIHSFNSLTAPGLVSLAIGGPSPKHEGLQFQFSPHSWDNKPIVDFLARSSCNITRLHFKWAPITGKDVLHLFQQMPHISSLTIEECSLHADGRQENNIVIPAFLESFCLDNSSSSSKPLLPHLASIALVVHADVNLQLLLEVLRSRQGRLRAADIAIIGHSDDADIEEFSAFRCLGLEMTIERYHSWIEH